MGDLFFRSSQDSGLVVYLDGGFPTLGGYLLGGPHNKVWGLSWGPPILVDYNLEHVLTCCLMAPKLAASQSSKTE